VVRVERSGARARTGGGTVFSLRIWAVFLEGDYKLSDELKRNGGRAPVRPEIQGLGHRAGLERHVRGPARHAFGYNSDEEERIARSESAFSERIAFGFNRNQTKRIGRSCDYNTVTREAFYPLLEWGCPGTTLRRSRRLHG
jgi:hypothetical protein